MNYTFNINLVIKIKPVMHLHGNNVRNEIIMSENNAMKKRDVGA